MEKKSLEEITEIWNLSGLLDGLPEHKKVIVAFTLERVALFLIKNPSKYEGISTVIFPITRRVLCNPKVCVSSFSISNFIKKVENGFEKFNIEFPSYNFYTGLDQEATFCVEFASNYKNDSRLFIEFC